MNRLIIGLTGPTGAGKSSLHDIAENLGFLVVDCDKSARRATEKGSECLNKLCEAFGFDILNDDKTLNRKALASKAFNSIENTEKLNKTIFPYIKNIVLNEAIDDFVIFDAPTLFESGLNTECFKTITVLADYDLRLKRIIKRDNISKEEAILRINAGKTDDYYKEKSDYIIYNNSNEAEYIYNFISIINTIKNDFLKEKYNE